MHGALSGLPAMDSNFGLMQLIGVIAFIYLEYKTLDRGRGNKARVMDLKVAVACGGELRLDLGALLVDHDSWPWCLVFP